MSFADKVVIVTGASSGIGAATAVQLTKEGANVVLVGRNQTKLNNVGKQCQEIGKKQLIVIADISKESDAKKIIDETIKTYGKLDVLVNNAGFGGSRDILAENSMELFDSIMATNVRGLIYLTHLAAPHLIKTKGNIVNISSIAARMAISNTWAYCTSKAAVDHFSRCIALDLAPKGVRVNVINPGPVRTDFPQNAGYDVSMVEDIFEGYGKSMPLGRVAEPEEIADLILFLASDKAKGITGSSYVSDVGALLVGSSTVRLAQK